MATYRLLIEYDGGSFHGWQRQLGPPTVQQALEEALEIILRCPTSLTAAGRTDRGVHATGQVAHFRSEEVLDKGRVQRSLNALTPPAIAVRALELAPEDFHARFDAIRRCYHYKISCTPVALSRHTHLVLLHPIDFSLMNRAAKLLHGRHHFGAFCLHRSEIRNRICTVHHAQWVQERYAHQWRFEIVADRFLHGMVRAIVGTLLDIGRGKRPLSDIMSILASKDRRQAGPAAPPHGLVLESVHYEEQNPFLA